jgi:hypothetical protein
MRLKVPYFDGRKWGYEEIIDEDTGKTVGHIRCNGTGSAGDGGIEISLFDKKYRATVNSRAECYGFVKGVEAVLNRITSIDDGRHKLERQLFEAKKKLSSYPMPGSWINPTQIPIPSAFSSLSVRVIMSPMAARIRIINHEAVHLGGFVK